MSGITPILDTLLHQVLGKRVDTPVVRDQPAPVSAATSEDAVQSARSDSRLHQQSQSRLGDIAGALDRGHPAQALSKSGEVPSSTQTHLSRAATDIAALLAKFPASSVATRSVQAPLFAETPMQSSALASAIREAIVSSGAFYESHLLRWSQGTFPSRALWREPQAWLALTFRPIAGSPLSLSPGQNAWLKSLPLSRALSSTPESAPVASRGASQPSFQGPLLAVSTRVATSSAPHGNGAPAHLDASRAQGGGTAAPAPDAAMMRSHQLGSQAAPETLQSLVRHQLELLVSPQVHWSGDIGPSTPVSIHMQPEESPDDSRAPRAGEAGIVEAWRIQVQVNSPQLGEIKLTLENRADQWKIGIRPDSATAVEPLEGAVAGLQSRFQNARIRADVTLTRGETDE